MSNEPEESGISSEMTGPPRLYDYIEDNHRLISTLGVFTALTLFARQVQPGVFGNFLSALFLTLTLLVLFELSERFPPKMGTSRMYWFESVMSLSVLFLAAHWLLTVRSVFPWITFFLVFASISSLISVLMKRYDLFNRLFRAKAGQRKTLRYFLGIFLVIVSAAVAIAVGSVVATAVDPVLDNADAWLSQ